METTKDYNEPQATTNQDGATGDMNNTRMVIPHPFCWRGRSDGGEYFRDINIDYEDIPLPYEQPMRTRAEMRMIAMSWAIRSKTGWRAKIKDPIIMEKWRREATEKQKEVVLEHKMTANMINYVLTELEAYAALVNEDGIQHACDDSVFISDTLMSGELRDTLKHEVSIFENVPESQKDWHPGSNGQVLDIVHPSLYCVVYNRTLARSGDTTNYTPLQPSLSEDEAEAAVYFSKRTAWLPSDFEVSGDGKRVTLVSPYINNIHPDKKDLYLAIESILGRFIPMWEKVLGSAASRVFSNAPYARGQALRESEEPEERKPYIDNWHADVARHSMRMPVPHCVLEKTEPKFIRGRTKPYYEQINSHWWNTEEGYREMDYEGFEGETQDERRRGWLRTQGITLPDSRERFEVTASLEEVFPIMELKGITVQVIVKLANIQLTPEQPKYTGGSWHVEGMINEAIVATGIYYYDSENISESELAFRVCVRPPMYHQQDDYDCMDILYGITRNTSLVQDRGSVNTCNGRALAFPNIYQHRVSPFHLTDPTKPGHRKILAFFLVDPNRQIPSTSTVPPQQREWFEKEVVTPQSTSRLARLPVELREMIAEEIPGPMSRKEANKFRKRLMAERSAFVKRYEEDTQGLEFDMCEH